MDLTVSSQITIFLFSMILGALLSLIFDVFRIINVMLKYNSRRIFFEDIIYFILSAIVTFTYILVVNMGEIRIYIIAGEIIGWLLYRFTIGAFVYKVILIIVKTLKKWILKIKKYIISKIPKEKVKKLNLKVKNTCFKFIKKPKFNKRILLKRKPKKNKKLIK